jgi:glycerophosphoryl diester phosphodiesterase
MEIVAHRGSSFLAPENTLAALKLGWEETTTCEVDVRSTADGRLLVIHDASTMRTTGIDWRVAEHALSELQNLDAGSWKDPNWSDEKLPSLEEVIAAMPMENRLLIEIKSGPEVVPELQRVIAYSGKARQILLQSFSLATCLEAKKRLPKIPVYFLVESTPRANDVIAQAKAGGLDGFNCKNTEWVSASLVEQVRAAGLKIGVWTVDEVEEARRYCELGVNALTTNRPGWLKAQLDGQRSGIPSR